MSEETLEEKVARLEKSEAALREQLTMQQQMLDAIQDLIILKDAESRWKWCNKAVMDYAGLDFSELDGAMDHPANRTDYVDKYIEDDAQVIRTGKTMIIAEEPALDAHGNLRFLNTIKSPVFSSDGVVRHLVAVARDITEQRSADQDRLRAERALNEAERLFAHMAESSRDVFFVASADWAHYIYVSPAFEAVWGRPVAELMDNPLIVIDLVMPEDRPMFLKCMREAETTGVANFEFRIERDDGVIRWLWAKTFPLLDELGNIFRICGIGHDITERKEVERRVNEFNSMVSHELRTPLTSIRAALGLIEGGQAGPTTDTTFELITIARDECDRLVRLINDLLDIKKMEANKIVLKFEQLYPENIVATVMTSLRHAAQLSDISLATGASATAPFVGDRDRIIQVLTNLVSNAVKFSPADSVVTISTKLIADQTQIKFSVEDHGVGIPEFARESLFEAFHQVDSSDSRAKGGTGLGLAICKGIIEKHGGSIGFINPDTGGSIFWFELPLEQPVRYEQCEDAGEF